MSTKFTSSSSHPGSHLSAVGVSFSYPARRVLTDISFTVPAGQRVGLIGENGCGKSTLLKVVAGKLVPDAGSVTASSDARVEARIGLLDQEPSFSLTRSINDALEDAVAPARSAVEQADSLARRLAQHPSDSRILAEYGDALDTVERLGAWTVDSRIKEVLGGLGLAGVDRERLAGSLSGGEQARLSLACLLLNAPDVLVMDEPTNHLDDSAAAFLVGMLTQWNGPVLVASHDRAFLDEAVTRLIDMDPTPVPHSTSSALLENGPGTGIGITQFSGNFSEYILARADARERWERQYGMEQAALTQVRTAAKKQTAGHTDWSPRTEVKAAQKFYADRNAKVVSRRVNDAKRKLAELEATQVRKPPTDLTFAGLRPQANPNERLPSSLRWWRLKSLSKTDSRLCH